MKLILQDDSGQPVLQLELDIHEVAEGLEKTLDKQPEALAIASFLGFIDDEVLNPFGEEINKRVIQYMETLRLINSKAIKEYVKTHFRYGDKPKRVSKKFLSLLAQHIEKKLQEAAAMHNGGKVTIDESVAIMIGLDK